MGVLHHLKNHGVTGADVHAAVQRAKQLTPLMGESPVNVTCTNNGTTVAVGGQASRFRQVVRFKIVGNASGGGQYTLRMLTGNSTADGSGNLAMPEGQGVPGDDDAIGLNCEENQLPTHWLKADEFSEGIIVGRTAAGVAIVQMHGGVARTASPSTLGGNTEGTEAAATDTWDRAVVTSGTNYGDSPLDLWVTCRVGYYDAGDETLYAYMRKLTFDASGRLKAVSAETRVAVDAPEAC